MKKKTLASILAFCLTLGMLAGCAPAGDTPSNSPAAKDTPSVQPTTSATTPASKDPIKLGCIQDLTGSAAESGVANAWGAQYAVDKINAEGGINGRMLELTTLDCKNDATEALNCYRKLVDETGIDALIGPPLSNSALTWVELVTEDEIPCVGHFMDETCTTNPDTGEVYPYMFLAEPGCAQQSYSIAKYAMEELGIKKFATLYNTANAFAAAHARPFMEYVKAYGGEVVAEETFGWADADYSAQAIKIAAANPEAVFLSDYAAQAKLCYQQLRAAGYEGVILGANTLATPFPDLVQGAVTDTYFLQNVDMYTEGTECYDLLQAYMKAEGKSYPVVNACFGYDAVMVMADAMKRANDPTDGKEVRDLLESCKDVATSSGPITIDPANHRTQGMGMYIGHYGDDNKVEIVSHVFVGEDAITKAP